MPAALMNMPAALASTAHPKLGAGTHFFWGQGKMMRHCNESYESARLQVEWEEAPRRPFLNAVRAYAGAAGSSRQAWLMESIIRTSRAIADDDGTLPEDVQIVLSKILERYRLLGLQDADFPLANYRQARKLITSLFF